MKEYSILVKHGSGAPYVLKTYTDIFSAKTAVQRIIDFEEERHRMYFVDNDYFCNKYGYVGNIKYLCIQVREVTEWGKYSEFSNSKIKNKNNIVYFNNYLKNT